MLRDTKPEVLYIYVDIRSFITKEDSVRSKIADKIGIISPKFSVNEKAKRWLTTKLYDPAWNYNFFFFHITGYKDDGAYIEKALDVLEELRFKRIVITIDSYLDVERIMRSNKHIYALYTQDKNLVNTKLDIELAPWLK